MCFEAFYSSAVFVKCLLKITLTLLFLLSLTTGVDGLYVHIKSKNYYDF